MDNQTKRTPALSEQLAFDWSANEDAQLATDAEVVQFAAYKVRAEAMNDHSAEMIAVSKLVELARSLSW